jgi:hypothetical protein
MLQMRSVRVALALWCSLIGCTVEHPTEPDRRADCASICDSRNLCRALAVDDCVADCVRDFQRARPEALHHYATCLAEDPVRASPAECDRHALYCYLAALFGEASSAIDVEFGDRCDRAYDACTHDPVQAVLDCRFSRFFVEEATREALDCLGRPCAELPACVRGAFIP